LVCKNTPFCDFNIIDLSKNSFHGWPIGPVMKLIEIDVIEYSKIAEKRRNYTSGCWHRDDSFDDLCELGEKGKKPLPKVLRHKVND
jgi:hypothetical protein